MKSIIQNKKECFICKTTQNLHCHHIFFGVANRKLSEMDGLKVYLCYEHHEGKTGVHNNRNLDLYLKKIAEKTYLHKHYKTKEEFIKRYGKNYL